MLNHSRKLCWILRARQMAKTIIKRCLRCQKHNNRKFDCLMAPLPRIRLDNQTHVLQFLTADCLGPIHTFSEFMPKPSEGQDEVYFESHILVLTCSLSRFTILVLMPNLTAESFLLALKEVQGLYSPQISSILLDNGTNFTSGARQLRKFQTFVKANYDKIEAEAGLLDINFKFIPAGASHMNALSERVVQLTKRSLRKAFHKQLLSHATLRASLAQIQGWLNQRPLTSYHNDMNSDPERILTPANLVFGTFTSAGEFNVQAFADTAEVRKRWSIREKCLNLFKGIFFNQRTGDSHQHQY